MLVGVLFFCLETKEKIPKEKLKAALPGDRAAYGERELIVFSDEGWGKYGFLKHYPIESS